MRDTSSEISLREYLSKRLLPGALAIWILLSLSLPLTYYVLESNKKKHTADLYANEISAEIVKIVGEYPFLWKYQIQKYLRMVHEYTNYKNILYIHVHDEHQELISEFVFSRQDENENDGFRIALGRAPVVFNNNVIGTVEVCVSMTPVLWNTFWIFLLSLLSGSGLAFYIYTFPVKVVKESEKMRGESESKYRDLAELLPQIVFETDVQGNYTFANRYAFEISGYTKEDMSKGLNALQLFIPEDRGRAWENIQRRIRGEDLGSVEYMAIKKDGSTFPVLLFASPIIHNDKVDGLRGIAIDITERKRLEEELRNYSARLEDKVKERTAELEYLAREWEVTFNSTTDQIMVLDTEFRIINANLSTAKFLGKAVGEIRGMNCYELLHGADNPPAECVIGKFKQSRKHEETEFYLPHKGVWIHASVDPIFNEKGEVISFVHIIRDITLRKKADEELQKALINAEAGNRAKSDFLANISHELSTPLNSVIGFSEVLLDELSGKLNEKQKEYAGNIFESGKNLHRVISDIIELSKIEAGSDELRLGRFNLKDLIVSSMAMFNEKKFKRKLNMDIEIAPEADIEIEGDIIKLKQVMFNLLSNAVKFTKDEGSVSVRARKVIPPVLPLDKGRLGGVMSDRDFIEISVTDTGIGMRPEDISRLFTTFQQLESPYTKTYSGTGIGLVLTKKLVELHGGRIWAESDYGKGSRFSFVIPVRQGSYVS